MIRKKDEGVSPVIAVILIVALTVILLGMAAAMFMGITSNAVGNMNTSFLQPTIKVVYDKNAVDVIGDVPVDIGTHYQGEIVTVADASNLKYPRYQFDSWNSNSDGSGTKYNVGEEITLYADVVLYARWIDSKRYSVIYERNDVNAKMIPAPVSEEYGKNITIKSAGNADGKQFVNWNTEPKGSGKEYNVDYEYNGSDGDITLYAQWNAAPPE